VRFETIAGIIIGIAVGMVIGLGCSLRLCQDLLPGEARLVFTGYLIFKHALEPLSAFALGFLGSIWGISVCYALGRTLGLFLITRLGGFWRVEPETLDHV
jgi:membrane protein DedA with SNARE-associated domain